MICARTSRRRDPSSKGGGVGVGPSVIADPTGGSQANFYYGAPAPYAESIAPSHHSTYAHYYDEEEDGWEMPNFYNETYMKGRWVVKLGEPASLPSFSGISFLASQAETYHLRVFIILHMVHGWNWNGKIWLIITIFSGFD